MIIRDLSDIENKIDIDSKRKKFISANLPGPVTFVLLNTDYKFLKQNTIGIRIPNHKITKLISRKANFPYTTTSANISGKDVCYSIKEIVEQFKDRVIQPDLILDGGDLSNNVPSTVIDIIKWPPKILRQGNLKIKL
jgi:tRNA threonylcarbamoyl adenosine modification protein (Sua5/YciO/YrdC/YwlC family)